MTADPNAWECGDCGAAPIPSHIDWCPACAEDEDISEALKLAAQRHRDYRDEIAEAAKLRQVGGDHYIKYAIQPFDIIDCYGLGFYAGNALKYLLRYRDKGGVEDLKKARHYIEKLIEVTRDGDAEG